MKLRITVQCRHLPLGFLLALLLVLVLVLGLALLLVSLLGFVVGSRLCLYYWHGIRPREYQTRRKSYHESCA